VVECLPSTHKALDSIPSTGKEKKREGKGREGKDKERKTRVVIFMLIS
jgi:hypothetical protein